MLTERLLKFCLLVVAVSLLSQCATTYNDCEALAARAKVIAQEKEGDYFIGRRYYVPTTRFWGYMRAPKSHWSAARLVVMDESLLRTPDRGYEYPKGSAIYGSDNNHEYIIKGDYTGKMAYEPNSNQVLPIFKAKSYELNSATPGYLFRPSEKYREDRISLYPGLVPTHKHCDAAGWKPQTP